MKIFRLQRWIANRKIFRKTALLLVCVALTVLFVPNMSVPSVSAASLETQKQQVENEKKALQEKQKTLQKQLDATKAEMNQMQTNKNQLNEKVANINKQIFYIEEQIKTFEDSIAVCEGSIAETQAAIDSKQADYNAQYELFKERVRMTYEKSDVSYLEILLDATSLTDFLSRIDRIGAMLEYDTRIMKNLTDSRLSLEQDRAELEAELAEKEAYLQELSGTKTDLNRTEADLKKQIDECIREFNELNANKTANEKQIAENAKAQKEADEEIASIAAEIARQAELAKSKYVGGEYMWPVPTSYSTVSSECGWRVSPITGKSEFHNGMDIPCKLGTDVYAANSGTVITATEHWSYGNYIMIDHGGGQVTLYAHNSKLLVSVGDTVKKGQVIAKAGTTGSSTGVHCHFSYYVNGTITNPRTILVQP